MAFQGDAKGIQRIHIKGNVWERNVQEHRCNQTPELPLLDERIALGTHCQQKVVSKEGTREHLQEIHANSHPQKNVRHQRLGERDAHLHWLNPAQFDGWLRCRGLRCRRSRRQTHRHTSR